MSIKITGSRSIKSANTAGPWNGQTAASARLRFMVPTGAIVNNIPLLISRDVYASILIAILSSPTAGSFRIKVYVVSAAGVDNIREVTLAQGVVYDLGVRHNGTTGSQTLLVDAVEYGIGSFTGATESHSSRAWCLGGYDPSWPPTNATIYYLDDVWVWNGVALDTADFAAMRDGTDPATLGLSATARYHWSCACPVGKVYGDSVAAGDSAIVDSISGFNLTNLSGAGTAVYDAPLVWEPTVRLDYPHVSTGGQMVFFQVASKLTGNLTTLGTINEYPSYSINGESPVAWTSGNFWNNPRHNYYGGPLHRPLTRGDTLRLTAPVGWTYTPVGVAEAIDQVAENRVGKTNFDVEGTVRTLRLGLGLTPVTQGWGNWLLAANQRMRLALFGATRDSLGAPLTISVSPYRQYFSKAAWSLGNGLDSTDYPGQVGFFAVGWNEHDRINFPITFKITDDLGGTGAPDFSIVERTAYNNPGTQNVSNPNRWDGIVRIFEVTRLPGYTTANVDLFLEVTCPSKNLQFSDFWILGPGDFTLGTPTVLDKSNPRRLAARLVDRMHGVQAIRFMETTIGTAGECPGIEPEDLISDSAFSWGEAYFRYSKTWNVTTIRPFVPASTPYLYHSHYGSKYSATLGSGINSTAIILTITDAATAPVMAGQRLFMDAEVLRVDNVSGTTVTVTRGMEKTTAAGHSAGAIQVGYRIPNVNNMSPWENDGQIVEFVTSTPHKILSGSKLEYSGSGWPGSLAFTAGGSNNIAAFAKNIWVTGPNSYLSHTYRDTDTVGSTVGCYTLSTTYSGLTNCVVSYNPGIEGTFTREMTAVAANELDCDLWCNIPFGATFDMVDAIASRILAVLTPGRRVYLELTVEPWNNGFMQWRYFHSLAVLLWAQSNIYYPLLDRSYAVYNRFKAAFTAAGRGGEVLHVVNIQDRQGDAANWVLDYAAAQVPPMRIDGVATGPYVEMPGYDAENSPEAAASRLAADNFAEDLDIASRIDFYIHHIYGCTTRYSYPIQWSAITRHVNDYNAATGYNCQQLCYEGGVQDTFGTKAEQRDFIYHPNFYLAEWDWYLLQQTCGIKLSVPFNIGSEWLFNSSDTVRYLWGFFHGVQQDYGRGDGSDGKANNLHCLARPGETYSKASNTNQDLNVVSVRSQAHRDWNAGLNLPVAIDRRKHWPPRDRYWQL